MCEAFLPAQADDGMSSVMTITANNDVISDRAALCAFESDPFLGPPIDP